MIHLESKIKNQVLTLIYQNPWWGKITLESLSLLNVEPELAKNETALRISLCRLNWREFASGLHLRLIIFSTLAGAELWLALFEKNNSGFCSEIEWTVCFVKVCPEFFLEIGDKNAINTSTTKGRIL